jgi:urocanate hydratase
MGASDGSADTDRKIRAMLHWDVNNGIARRAWARNDEAISAINRAMQAEPHLRVTLPNFVDDALLISSFKRFLLTIQFYCSNFTAISLDYS